MVLRFRLVTLVLPLGLLACIQPIPATVPVAVAPQIENACGAADLQNLVGQPVTALQTMRFGVVTRIIQPGTIVTMDYAPARLNIQVGDREIISGVRCG